MKHFFFFLSIEVWTNYLQVIQFLASSSILKLKLFCRAKALQIDIFVISDLWKEKYCLQISNLLNNQLYSTDFKQLKMLKGIKVISEYHFRGCHSELSNCQLMYVNKNF